MSSNRWRLVLAATVAACAFRAPAWGAVVTLQANRDNTLYETTDGSLSNGAGDHLFAGRTAGANIRRALVAFDPARSVPAGSTIDSATLTLHLSLTSSGPQTVSVHRVLKEWGEGASDAPGEEGGGTRSTPGDATWVHAFFPADVWVAPGGDFERVASASAIVDQVLSYAWSSDALAEDVQAWLDAPASNHGWILVGEEASSPTSKRFDSREHLDRSVRPVLVVSYSEPPAVPALSPLGASATVLLILAAWLVVGRRAVAPQA